MQSYCGGQPMAMTMRIKSYTITRLWLPSPVVVHNPFQTGRGQCAANLHKWWTVSSDIRHMSTDDEPAHWPTSLMSAFYNYISLMITRLS